MSTETDLAPEGRGVPGPFDPTAGRQATATQWASEHAKIIADPAPLGLAGFALTTFLLSLVNAGVIPAGGEPMVFGLALAYGGIAQLLAGMWEFRKGNTFGATAFASYGAFWISFWALTTFVLSMVNSGLVSSGAEPVVFGLALAYGGIGQLLAGMWEFKTGNTFGATAFASYGAFWISFWALVQFFVKDIPAADAGHAVGLYLWAWGIFTGYMFIASLRTSVAVAVVFFLLTLTFILLGIGNSHGSEAGSGLVKIGGYVGLATALAAWYASFAQVINSTFGRDVAPLGPLNR